jgi:hypothetical protein
MWKGGSGIWIVLPALALGVAPDRAFADDLGAVAAVQQPPGGGSGGTDMPDTGANAVPHVPRVASPVPVTSGQVSSGMHFDELFTFQVPSGCTYSASIRGVVRPVVAGAGAGRDYEPDLDITAVLTCPNVEPVKVKEKVAQTGPLSRAQLETLLARRASILAEEDHGRRCSYVPEITLTGDALVGRGVTYLCQLRDAGQEKAPR